MNRIKAGALGLGLSFAAVNCASNTESILDKQLATPNQQATPQIIGRILCKGPDYKGMGIEFVNLWPTNTTEANAKLTIVTGVAKADITLAPIGYARCNTEISPASVIQGIRVAVEGPIRSAVSAETFQLFQSNCAVVGLPANNSGATASKDVVVACPTRSTREAGTI